MKLRLRVWCLVFLTHSVFKYYSTSTKLFTICKAVNSEAEHRPLISHTRIHRVTLTCIHTQTHYDRIIDDWQSKAGLTEQVHHSTVRFAAFMTCRKI